MAKKCIFGNNMNTDISQSIQAFFYLIFLNIITERYALNLKKQNYYDDTIQF